MTEDNESRNMNDMIIMIMRYDIWQCDTTLDIYLLMSWINYRRQRDISLLNCPMSYRTVMRRVVSDCHVSYYVSFWLSCVDLLARHMTFKMALTGFPYTCHLLNTEVWKLTLRIYIRYTHPILRYLHSIQTSDTDALRLQHLSEMPFLHWVVTYVLVVTINVVVLFSHAWCHFIFEMLWRRN